MPAKPFTRGRWLIIGLALAVLIVIGTVAGVIWFNIKRRNDREDSLLEQKVAMRDRSGPSRGPSARPFSKVRDGDRPDPRIRDFSRTRDLPRRTAMQDGLPPKD